MVKFLQGLLELEMPKEQILYSIGVALLGKISNSAIVTFLKDYEMELLEFNDLPKSEFDLLGTAYQYLNSRHENLEKGSFYTGGEIANDFVLDLDFSSGQTIFDPSCGSGAFLFRSGAAPEQIFGVDLDPIAVMIAKFNYFLKFPKSPAPQIYCQDFYEWFRANPNARFDYIIGNPPYGANLTSETMESRYVVSGESFSYFIEYSFQLLTDGGLLRFLVPEALLNVKRHSDIRTFILDQTELTRIKSYSKKFTGVMSSVYMIELQQGKTRDILFEGLQSNLIPKRIFDNLNNRIFVNLNKIDMKIIEKVESVPASDLSSSIFGLGVVTGDNENRLLSSKVEFSEPIYSGKEVEKYRLLPPKNFLVFDRTVLQQVAPDEIYRAPKKLVYKTINLNLKFALDTTQALTTNSANIVIPQVSHMHIETVLGFLNSDLYSYLHRKLFGGVNKVAKENLMALPMPTLDSKKNDYIRDLVLQAILDGNDSIVQEYIHKEVYALEDEEIRHLRETLAV